MRPARSQRAEEESGLRRRPRLAVLYPTIGADDEDTVVEDSDDAFDALLRAPVEQAPPREPVEQRTRDAAFTLFDLAEGALECFTRHRDARVLSAIVAAATAHVILSAVLLAALVIALAQPEPELVKETHPKRAPAVVVVPIMVPVVVRQQVEVERRARLPRSRRAR